MKINIYCYITRCDCLQVLLLVYKYLQVLVLLHLQLQVDYPIYVIWECSTNQNWFFFAFVTVGIHTFGEILRPLLACSSFCVFPDWCKNSYWIRYRYLCLSCLHTFWRKFQMEQWIGLCIWWYFFWVTIAHWCQTYGSCMHTNQTINCKFSMSFMNMGRLLTCLLLFFGYYETWTFFWCKMS